MMTKYIDIYLWKLFKSVNLRYEKHLILTIENLPLLNEQFITEEGVNSLFAFVIKIVL